jgi:hypothetical protein
VLFFGKIRKGFIKSKKVISGIMKRFTVIEVNEEILNRALYSKIDDFEDAVIEVSASEKNVDYINWI